MKLRIHSMAYIAIAIHVTVTVVQLLIFQIKSTRRLVTGLVFYLIVSEMIYTCRKDFIVIMHTL